MALQNVNHWEPYNVYRLKCSMFKNIVNSFLSIVSPGERRRLLSDRIETAELNTKSNKTIISSLQTLKLSVSYLELLLRKTRKLAIYQIERDITKASV